MPLDALPLTRRHLLRAGLTVTTLAACPSWARALALQGRQPRLVVVMLRGAVDGLHVVAPHGDPAYARARPRLALPPPSAEAGTLALTSLFGLHPAAAALYPWWQRGLLGFVHASGSPDPTRSHFDAQAFMESGTPGRKATPDGWMNRLLAQSRLQDPSRHGLQQGSTPARIWAGAAPVLQLGLGQRATQTQAIDQAGMQAKLAQLYAQDPALARTYAEATEGRQAVREALRQSSERQRMQSGMRSDMGASAAMAAGDERPSRDPSADGGAAPPSSFAADAQRLGELLRADPRVQLAFTSVGGWDTHINQGQLSGALPNRLRSLTQGLDALAQGLGDSLRDTVIVVMSEFGRTVRENGTGGTDHGRGNAMWLLGGALQGAAGGQVLGEWPSLEDRALADGRDLAITTDFRQVLAGLIRQHLGLGEDAVAAAFPGWVASGRALPLVRT